MASAPCVFWVSGFRAGPASPQAARVSDFFEAVFDSFLLLDSADLPDLESDLVLAFESDLALVASLDPESLLPSPAAALSPEPPAPSDESDEPVLPGFEDE